MPQKIDTNNIEIGGAEQHNLKNVYLNIPKDKLIVITGLSGSGKSSLAFDTIYTEGQRRYIESLSSYARLFMGKLEKPKVKYIKGIAPAIAIKQKVTNSNPRSTVGTTSEVYDYIKLLYARIGKTFSPVSGQEVKKESTNDVINFIDKNLPLGSSLQILAKYQEREDRSFQDQLKVWNEQGFSRILIDGNIQKIKDLIDFDFQATKEQNIFLLIDRIEMTADFEKDKSRLTDSLETAFYEGFGKCEIKIDDKVYGFSNSFELDGITFTEPNLHFFSFNNPFGACPRCEGYGKIVGIDEELVIPNKKLSLYDDAIAPWKGDKMSKWKEEFIYKSSKHDFPIHKPYLELSEKDKNLLWNGTRGLKGINQFFQMLEENAYKIQYRVMLSRYRGRTICPSCKGSRLREETNNVKINNTAISALTKKSIDELADFFGKLKLSDYEKEVSKRILIEINNRLAFLSEVGLGYLTLNRASNSLSGGESQRINLATGLGSSLVGSIYILDEPSIGLHTRDTQRLIKVLKKLRDLGNTVIVVEHDEEIMLAADEIIDMGPDAGSIGGEVCFQGNMAALKKADTWTSKYLSRELEIIRELNLDKIEKKITIKGARENNLKDVDVEIPLERLCVITGVSGSGKSTLVKNILVPSLNQKFDVAKAKPGNVDSVELTKNAISSLEWVDQNPIGKSSRSNPITYIKAYDEIRKLYSLLPISKNRGYKIKHFSFNIDGGRCDHCKGDGKIVIEMQFMADVELVCEDCNGNRFKDQILEVKFQDKNIADILDMTIADAYTFFEANNQKKIAKSILPLIEVGMGYVKMGQSSNTLSGGEAQRIKLASFIGKGKTTEKTLFIFDEPSTGLHFHDISKLMISLQKLIDQGHSVLLIEHNVEIIKCADWVIDLGPEGGSNGGQVMYQGDLLGLYSCKNSLTAEAVVASMG